MTQEEKQLLLIDLSARLPYGVKVRHITESAKKLGASYLIDVLNPTLYKYILEDNILAWPYLRPMSSMTEEEKREYQAFFNYDGVEYPEEYIDWLNSHHFDYRDLIGKGLALEASEGMYKNE